MADEDVGSDKKSFINTKINKNLVKKFTLLLLLGLVFWGYEYSRAVAAKLSPEIHYTLLLKFEEKLFGSPLVLFFQAHRFILFDIIFSIIYSLHPAYILVLLLFLFLKDEKLYEHSIISFGFAGLVAIICYILCPVAPPWIAVPGITRLKNPVLVIFGHGHSIDPNPYAAMPSMHVASSILVAYYLMKLMPKSNIVKIIGYSLIVLMIIAVIYTGNHYLLDAIVGLLLAYGSLRISDYLMNLFTEIGTN